MKLALAQINPLTRDLEGNSKKIVEFVDYDETKTMRSGKKVKWNAAAIIQNGKILQIRHKSLLPNYDVFDDWRYFKAGTEEDVQPTEVEIDGKKIKLGILICEELWEDDYDFLKPVKLM